MIEPYYQADRVTLYLGDCIEVMRELPEASVDAIVTDPPYGLEFMGKDWDAPWESDSHVGKRMVDGWSGVEMADGADRLKRPTYEKTSNVRCRKCERWRLSSNPCVCADPDFPNLRLANMREFQRWCEAWAREAYRVLKPGAFLVAFGGTRTDHRLACGIEDAGFEIRNTLAWMFGSGFPKSMDVERAVAMEQCQLAGRHWMRRIPPPDKRQPGDHVCPETPDSLAWAGFGTDLKPGFEPARLARKPLAGNVAQNVLAHGTGAINIDGCRIGLSEADRARINAATWNATRLDRGAYGAFERDGNATPLRAHDGGRWPANVILDEEAAALLDATGEVSINPAGVFANEQPAGWGGGTNSIRGNGTGTRSVFGYGDRGGPSRFFYTAKASRSEREAGLDHVPPALRTDGREAEGPGASNPRLRVSERHNDHPTVKPVSLMRWLVRLVTPPGGVVLDPFMGSGSTGLGALDRHDLTDDTAYRFIGIDITPRYAELARWRIEHRHLATGPAQREATESVPQGRLL